MTRAEILRLAALELRDTTPEFIAQILDPAFTLVLLDLAGGEAIRNIVDSKVFDVTAARDYETREITQLTPHYPARIISLVVYEWGPQQGVVRRARSDEQWEQARLQEATTVSTPQVWQLWRLHPNNRVLQVSPVAGADQVGKVCEVTFERPPQAIALDQDVLDIEAEDIPTVVAGLKARGAIFSEDTEGSLGEFDQVFQAGLQRMWGRRHNPRSGRIRADPDEPFS